MRGLDSPLSAPVPGVSRRRGFFIVGRGTSSPSPDAKRPCTMVKRANTKRHWTLLAVARYYKQYGEACRIRDLYPHVQRIHDDPKHLGTALSDIRSKELIDHLMVYSPNRSKSKKGRTRAYYPTKATRERLRDLGEPTEMPGHEPLPEGADVSIPTSIVGKDESPDPPSDIDKQAPDYDRGPTTSSKQRPVDPDTDYLTEDAAYDLTTMSETNPQPDDAKTEPDESPDLTDIVPEDAEEIDLDTLRAHPDVIADETPTSIELRDGRGVCTDCGAVYQTLGASSSHYGHVHSDDEPEPERSTTCPVCAFEAVSHRGLRIHQATRHSDDDIEAARAETEPEPETPDEPTPAANGESLADVFADGGPHAIDDFTVIDAEAVDSSRPDAAAESGAVALAPSAGEGRYALPDIAENALLAEHFHVLSAAIEDVAEIHDKMAADAIRALAAGLTDDETTVLIRRIATIEGISDEEFQALHEGFTEAAEEVNDA